MKSTANSKRMAGPKVALAVTSALAGALLTGCTANVAPPANLSANQAEAAMAQGKHTQAVTHAEAAVLAEPQSAAYRAVLGSAYLDAGRFASAETAFKDAIQLGDTSARSALSLSLALTAQAKYAEAAALLNSRESDIATADLGLALALAGQPERGIYLMGSAIRGGDNTAKMRQNLAYSYALAGRWREARLMAAQDVPAGQLDDRIGQWAQMAAPEARQLRVAALLQVPAGVRDGGQPLQLALSNNPSVDQLAAESTAIEAAGNAELPSLAVAAAPAQEAPMAQPAQAAYEAPRPARSNEFAAAFSAPAPMAPAPVVQDAARFVQAPVVQAVPARTSAPAARAVARAAQGPDGTHLVQLGSFSSEAGARRAWSIYTKNYPELAGHEMVVSEAVVRGKHYWRVAAAGFGRSSSSAMCGRVRASGAGCFAYAEGTPLPGAIDTAVRMARR